MPKAISAARTGVSVVLLEKGDTLLIYTDGITESRNDQNMLFGVERMLQSVRNNHQNESQAILESILEDLNEFCEGIPQEDDKALIVLKKLKP